MGELMIFRVVLCFWILLPCGSVLEKLLDPFCPDRLGLVAPEVDDTVRTAVPAVLARALDANHFSKTKRCETHSCSLTMLTLPHTLTQRKKEFPHSLFSLGQNGSLLCLLSWLLCVLALLLGF